MTCIPDLPTPHIMGLDGLGTEAEIERMRASRFVMITNATLQDSASPRTGIVAATFAAYARNRKRPGSSPGALNYAGLEIGQ